MTPQDTMQQALEALEYASTGNRRPEIIGTAIEALKAALAQQDKDESDSLTIAYLSGYDKGKKDALAQQGSGINNEAKMSAEKIMRLADDYAYALGNSYAGTAPEARSALEAALSQQGEQQPELSTASKSEQLLASQDHALRAEFQRMKAALAQQGEQQPVAWRVWRGDAYELYFDHVAAARRGERFVPHRHPEPLFAGAAPAAQPLSDEQIDSVSPAAQIVNKAAFREFARWVEMQHGIGVDK